MFSDPARDRPRTGSGTDSAVSFSGPGFELPVPEARDGAAAQDQPQTRKVVNFVVLFLGVYIKDLLSFVTKSVKEIEHVMNVGNQNRSVGATNMNEHRLNALNCFIVKY